jgi:hypothetical protein
MLYEGVSIREMNTMEFRKVTRAGMVIATLFFLVLAGAVYGKAGWKKTEVELRVSNGLKITSVSRPVKSLIERETAPYPEPPLGGFTPLVAITASDESGIAGDFEYEHVLEDTYVGSALPDANSNVVIGIFDSGSVVDLAAGASADALGLEGGMLTGNTIPIGGIGDEIIYAPISWPVGIFAGSLSAINNGQIDPNQVIGHSNVSVVVAPEISCVTGEEITAVVGTPFISFYTTVILNEHLQTANLGGSNYTGPDVQILDPYDAGIPTYPRSVAMEASGITLLLTANYYPDFGDLETPIFPTMLSMSALSIPFGGAFFAEIEALEGEPGPTNPLEDMRVMVDTGAQISIMTEGMAANLSLPTQGDFTVDVCGVGGLVEDVPGYYIDYVKINALGGAMEFSNAPFIVLDIGSPDGLPLDGILGMNFFWNRNIVFEPTLTGSSFIHVSDPVPFADADIDDDGDTDLEDFAVLSAAWRAQAEEGAYNPACDMFIDTVIDMKDLLAFLDRWLVGAAP